MKPEEASAQKYLRKNYGNNIVFEPRGKNTAPDFSVNVVHPKTWTERLNKINCPTRGVPNAKETKF